VAALAGRPVQARLGELATALGGELIGDAAH
jgi:hypothetical protein